MIFTEHKNKIKNIYHFKFNTTINNYKKYKQRYVKLKFIKKIG